MLDKQCFIAMPIRQPGTEEHSHFLQVFESFFIPPLERKGFTVKRGDFDRQSGAITRSIVSDLANADLVLADLTTLNPNVMYEIGIRHTLRKFGTILVFDQDHRPTDKPPFDLADYRHLRYKFEVGYISRFHTELIECIDALEAASETSPDNPIHDYLPFLPDNLAVSGDDRERQLTSQISEISGQLDAYRERHGELESSKETGFRSAKHKVSKLVATIRSGNHPSDVVKRCLEAIEQKNIEHFADAIEDLSELSELFPSDTEYVEIALRAEQAFGAGELARTIIELGLSVHEFSELLVDARLSTLRSGSRIEKEEAKREIEERLGISADDVSGFSKKFETERAIILVLFDILNGFGEFEYCIRLCDEADRAFGPTSFVAQNRARAIEGLYGAEASLKVYRRALSYDDLDDQLCVWYGNTLNNMKNYRGAAEAYLRGCLLDPNDGGIFAHVAQSITRYFNLRRTTSTASFPATVTKESAIEFIQAAVSVPLASADVVKRLRETAKDLNQELEQLLRGMEQVTHDSDTRYQLARHYYDEMASEVTEALVRYR